jgi:hypothetical protein
MSLVLNLKHFLPNFGAPDALRCEPNFYEIHLWYGMCVDTRFIKEHISAFSLYLVD